MHSKTHRVICRYVYKKLYNACSNPRGQLNAINCDVSGVTVNDSVCVCVCELIFFAFCSGIIYECPTLDVYFIFI